MASSLFSLLGEGEDEDVGVDETAAGLTLEAVMEAIEDPDEEPPAEVEVNNVDKVLETFGGAE